VEALLAPQFFPAKNRKIILTAVEEVGKVVPDKEK